MLDNISYHFRARQEPCLRSGANHDRHILLIPPLFDEMNRMRRALCDVMRLLEEADIGAFMPDLPGTGESLTAPLDNSLSLWTDAIAELLNQYPEIRHAASFRGGCLVTSGAADLSNWQLSPVKGANLLRTMMRTRIASDKEGGVISTLASLSEAVRLSPLMLAGNEISNEMFAELSQAQPPAPTRLRIARLEGDSKSADVKLAGSPLWLRAEPDADLILSKAIADDLAAWAAK